MLRPLNIVFIVVFFCITAASAQHGLVKTNKGQTEFFSKAAGPAQDIYAIDKTGEVKLDLSSGHIDVKINMKSFSLPRSLMQKHYNERYMETGKFPYATFSGKIVNWSNSQKGGTWEATVSGDLTVHGVTKKREIKGTITKDSNSYQINTVFDVRLADHGIEIPVLFFNKITEAVKVTAKYRLDP